MNGFRKKVFDQMEIAEKLLCLHAEVERKKQIQELLVSLNINESADYLSNQINDLYDQLKKVQKQFDRRMNEVIESFRSSQMS